MGMNPIRTPVVTDALYNSAPAYVYLYILGTGVLAPDDTASNTSRRGFFFLFKQIVSCQTARREL